MNKKLFSISSFFLTLSVLLFFYIAYKSQISHQGNNNVYYLKYFIADCVFVILSLISYKVHNELKKKILVVFTSCILSLYMCEFLYDFINEHQIQKNYLQKNGRKFDLRSRKQVFDERRKIDPSIVLNISPYNHIKNNKLKILPLSGISKSKTLHCNELGYFSFFKTDRYGFNNPDEEWDKKEIEYLLVGDSMVHGACVFEPQSISGNLRAMLTNTNNSVINIGQSGNGPLLEYATYREYSQIKNKIKNILWFYYEGNDIENLHNELKNNILKKYLESNLYNQNLKQRQNEVDTLNQEVFKKSIIKLNTSKKKYYREKLYKFIKLTNLRLLTFEKNNYKNSFYKKNAEIPKEFKDILKKVKKNADMINANVYFVYLPNTERYTQNKESDNDFKNYNEVLEIVSSLGIEILDIKKKVFDKSKNPINLYSSPIFYHYTEEGYYLIAKKIKEIIDLKNK